MTSTSASPLYGNLNLLILSVLAHGPMHGLAVGRRIREMSGGDLQIEEGALYPALHRLRRDGLIASRWGTSEQNRRARFYELTKAGVSRLDREMATWQRHVRAMTRVIEPGSA